MTSILRWADSTVPPKYLVSDKKNEKFPFLYCTCLYINVCAIYISVYEESTQTIQA